MIERVAQFNRILRKDYANVSFSDEAEEINTIGLVQLDNEETPLRYTFSILSQNNDETGAITIFNSGDSTFLDNSSVAGNLSDGTPYIFNTIRIQVSE